MLKSFSILFAIFALLNTVDVHAYSHIICGDDHSTIENCETCEEFTVVSEDDYAVFVPFSFYFTNKTRTFYKSPIFIPNLVVVNQDKHLGKLHNKPPPAKN